jgi:4-hydroxythreonine-4-phosphate dehydrogenase
VAQPRIAVTGLNPHAGDGGSIGMEEIEIIAPAIEQLRAEGFDARGPFSPDTVFIGARRGDVDAVVSMYHDQGQIAMKLMGFEQGVTLHGGLPVPVATSASGSAFDIAGKGIAQRSKGCSRPSTCACGWRAEWHQAAPVPVRACPRSTSYSAATR